MATRMILASATGLALSVSLGAGLMGICNNLEGLYDVAGDAVTELAVQACSDNPDPGAVDRILQQADIVSIEGEAWDILENLGVAENGRLRDYSGVTATRTSTSTGLQVLVDDALNQAGVAMSAIASGDAEAATTALASAELTGIVGSTR